MSDIKLFRVDGKSATELQGQSAVIEKSLQVLMEQHLETFLGVTFLASEYATGKTHGGRIDSLGIDENFSPVIIEYKRAMNENVINQGLVLPRLALGPSRRVHLDGHAEVRLGCSEEDRLGRHPADLHRPRLHPI